MDYRTDLAMERTVRPGGMGAGVSVHTQQQAGAEVTWVRVSSEKAAERLGKAQGLYWTLTHPKLPHMLPEERMDIAREVALMLRMMLPPQGDVLVLGLGNRRMTADALGDRVVSGILVTRHMQEERLRSVCAVAPGVLGITGVETAELALGLQMKIETSAGKGNEQELASLVSKLRNNVRNISHELMPPEFEHLSLDQILDRYAAKLTENTGIEVSYHPTENNASRHLPNETAYELYRIVQEPTMNIVKHASASHIVISLRADNENKYTLQITDNGKNANKQQTATNNNDGIGLHTVNDRIRAINATANVCSSTENNVFTLLLNINE